ncbi:hypothetical protein M514_19245 [Trichuris suis]|uniref:Uncharacterized protein n=1 Tax=Trichuris suis TaxID=68888 RepID=A0A085NGL6_9BILA|nr:hypothetical protein M514_19245 [Trichuris suis]
MQLRYTKIYSRLFEESTGFPRLKIAQTSKHCPRASVCLHIAAWTDHQGSTHHQWKLQARSLQAKV